MSSKSLVNEVNNVVASLRRSGAKKSLALLNKQARMIVRLEGKLRNGTLSPEMFNVIKDRILENKYIDEKIINVKE